MTGIIDTTNWNAWKYYRQELIATHEKHQNLLHRHTQHFYTIGDRVELYLSTYRLGEIISVTKNNTGITQFEILIDQSFNDDKKDKTRKTVTELSDSIKCKLPTPSSQNSQQKTGTTTDKSGVQNKPAAPPKRPNTKSKSKTKSKTPNKSPGPKKKTSKPKKNSNKTAAGSTGKKKVSKTGSKKKGVKSGQVRTQKKAKKTVVEEKSDNTDGSKEPKLDQLLKQKFDLPRVICGDTVKVKSIDCNGTLEFIGYIREISKTYSGHIASSPAFADIRYGVKLDRPVGDTDGSIDGKQFFTASSSSHGVFAKFDDIVRIDVVSDLKYPTRLQLAPESVRYYHKQKWPYVPIDDTWIWKHEELINAVKPYVSNIASLAMLISSFVPHLNKMPYIRMGQEDLLQLYDFRQEIAMIGVELDDASNESNDSNACLDTVARIVRNFGNLDVSEAFDTTYWRAREQVRCCVNRKDVTALTTVVALEKLIANQIMYDKNYMRTIVRQYDTLMVFYMLDKERIQLFADGKDSDVKQKIWKSLELQVGDRFYWPRFTRMIYFVLVLKDDDDGNSSDNRNGFDLKAGSDDMKTIDQCQAKIIQHMGLCWYSNQYYENHFYSLVIGDADDVNQIDEAMAVVFTDHMKRIQNRK